MKIKLTYADATEVIVEVPDSTIAFSAEQVRRQAEAVQVVENQTKRGVPVKAERVE